MGPLGAAWAPERRYMNRMLRDYVVLQCRRFTFKSVSCEPGVFPTGNVQRVEGTVTSSLLTVPYSTFHGHPGVRGIRYYVSVLRGKRIGIFHLIKRYIEEEAH